MHVETREKSNLSDVIYAVCRIFTLTSCNQTCIMRRFSPEFVAVKPKCDDAAANILANIMNLKSRLKELFEPDFGLLSELLGMNVLSRPELADVRSERTVYRRNAATLNLLVTEDQCGKFLKALQRTGQQHVVNYITENGGEKPRSSLAIA